MRQRRFGSGVPIDVHSISERESDHRLVHLSDLPDYGGAGCRGDLSAGSACCGERTGGKEADRIALSGYADGFGDSVDWGVVAVGAD